ncbi:hypothetical protein CP532_1578 [Ophiocordyceps camponoti-leonardi (nom. inval.)]|nr:hypothetical protein CP532_1578 [Ophiocordyceps camponoti-leonardi (nom. inval.)]
MPDDIIVPLRSPTAPISGLTELQAHLEALSNDPSLRPDAKLLDQVELQLTGKKKSHPSLSSLLSQTGKQKKTDQHDQSALLSLSIKLISPLSLSQSLVFADRTSLLNALRSPHPAANLLALAVVGKAASSPAEAEKLAELPDIVVETLRRWLDSPDVGVGERAAKVLARVLETDCGSAAEVVNGTCNDEPRPHGRHRIWPIIFEDDNNLAIIRHLCTLGHDPSRSTYDVTISQGRLLRLLPPLAALDIRSVTAPTFLPDANQGLLQWAGLSMVDKSDRLMHLSLVDFYESLVASMRHIPHARDATLKSLVNTAARGDSVVDEALRTLADRVEDDDAPDVRSYVAYLLS